MTHQQTLKLLSLLIVFKTETAFADVNLQEGSFNFTQTETLQISKKEQLSFARSYSSRSDQTGLMGLGWCSEFEWSLVQSGPETWLQKCDDIEVLPSLQIKVQKNSEIHVQRKDHTLIFAKDGSLSGFQNSAKQNWVLHRNLKGQPTLLLSPSGTAATFVYGRSPLLEKIIGLQKNFVFQYRQNLLISVHQGSLKKETYSYDDFFNIKTLKHGSRVLASIGYFDALDTVAFVREDGCQSDFKYESKEDADFVKDRVLETRTCPGRSPQLKESHFQYNKTSDHQVILQSRSSGLTGE